MDQRPPLLSIALLSAGILAYEILLMRLFSIIQWHHFAYMIISLALLGYGMSGSFVSIIQYRLTHKFELVYTILVTLCGISSLGAFLFAQTIPFNAEEIVWDIGQVIHLLLLFLVLMVPFFFGASAICLALCTHGRDVPRIYGYDLIGAGLGSIAIIVLLYMLFPQTVLVVVSSIIVLAAVVASWELGLIRRRLIIALLALLIMVVAQAIPPVELNLSPYKAVEQSLRISGSRIIEQRSSPMGLLTVLESNTIPLRHVPGLSFESRQEPLEQLGIFTDGDNLSVITKKAEERQQLGYLDQLSSALAYHLDRPDTVLVLGAGGGTEIRQAQYHQTPHIDAVELNPQIPELIRNRFADYAGPVFDEKTTNLYVDENRGFVKKTSQRYDLIQLALTDGFSGSASGVYALSESYLYTVEGLQDYISRLAPGGYLAITRWIKMPPRDTLKIFATAVKSLKGMEVKKPENRLVLIRSWQTSTLLVKQGDFNKIELGRVRNFCKARSFDIAFSPELTSEQANQYNILHRPIFYLATTALVSERADTFIDNYKFDIEPATDDRPYFHHFFKWSSFGEILGLRDQGSVPLLESGYLVLVATLLTALIVSCVAILLPLWILQKETVTQQFTGGKKKVLVYFFLIGVAFLFIEIAFLQKFILFLHHPIFSISTCLAAFLVFAGIGSYCSRQFTDIFIQKKGLKIAISGVVLVCLCYVLFLDHLFVFAADLNLAIRMLISVFLIAPLATCMGMPFPIALKDLADRAERLIPLAWGINGCASVISASLATLLAIHFGFMQLIFLACVLYCIACWLFVRSR